MLWGTGKEKKALLFFEYLRPASEVRCFVMVCKWHWYELWAKAGKISVSSDPGAL